MDKCLFEVFGLGRCSLDYIGKVNAYPPHDVKCEFFDMVIQAGGDKLVSHHLRTGIKPTLLINFVFDMGHFRIFEGNKDGKPDLNDNLRSNLVYIPPNH